MSGNRVKVPGGLHLQARFFSATQGVWKFLGNLESAVVRENIERVNVDRPIYVTSLARAGTTILTELLDSVEQAIANGVTLIQYRDHSLDGRDYRQRLKQIRQCCVDNDVLLIANTSLENFQQHDADGLHLTSRRLLDCQQRPVNESTWLGASVHNLSQLQHALSINVDYVLLSPVKYTASHPDALPIGWSGFQSMALQSSVPVYALGGMTDDDLTTAIAYGGQGIAGISLFS